MAQPAGVTWDQLSRDVKEALGWAAAYFPRRPVGTAGPACGLVRAPGFFRADLLEHLGVTPGDLLTELAGYTPSGHALDLGARAPVALRGCRR